MIKFIDINQEKPYLNFKNKYELALKKGQKILRHSISSYNPEKKGRFKICKPKVYK